MQPSSSTRNAGRECRARFVSGSTPRSVAGEQGERCAPEMKCGQLNWPACPHESPPPDMTTAGAACQHARTKTERRRNAPSPRAPALTQPQTCQAPPNPSPIAVKRRVGVPALAGAARGITSISALPRTDGKPARLRLAAVAGPDGTRRICAEKRCGPGAAAGARTRWMEIRYRIRADCRLRCSCRAQDRPRWEIGKGSGARV